LRARDKSPTAAVHREDFARQRIGGRGGRGVAARRARVPPSRP
jgi:hypothetical protein